MIAQLRAKPALTESGVIKAQRAEYSGVRRL
jgi:hypothetical protein